MKTVAAVLVETGKPVELAELEIPKLKPGQALVEIAFSGACHTQVMEIRGHKGDDPWVPHCLGHEGTGTVVDTGSAVTKVKQGDQVVLSWIKAGGIDAGGAVYRWNGRDVNAGGVTTFARHAVVSENRLTHLGQGVSPRQGIMLGCALPTGLGAVFNTLEARPGQSIAVFGCGGIGSSALMAARVSGCVPVIAVDTLPMKLELAGKLGASHCVDATNGDVVQHIRDICPGGVDLAVEATGVPAVMRQALECVRGQGGRAVVVGNAPHGSRIDIDPRLFNDGKSLLGTWGGDSQPDRDYPRFTRLMASGGIDVSPLLSAPYRLEDINSAIDDLEAGRIGRPVIDMNLA